MHRSTRRARVARVVLAVLAAVTGIVALSTGPAHADTNVHTLRVDAFVSELVDYDSPDPSDVCRNQFVSIADSAQLPSDPILTTVNHPPQCDEALFQVRFRATLGADGTISGTVTTELYDEDCVIFFSCDYDTVGKVVRSFTLKPGQQASVDGRIDDFNQSAVTYRLALKAS